MLHGQTDRDSVDSHRILTMKTDFKEIDEGTGYIGYQEAFDIIGIMSGRWERKCFPSTCVQVGLLPLTLWRR